MPENFFNGLVGCEKVKVKGPRVKFWWSWKRQTPSSQKEPAMPRIHLTLEEQIGIKVFVAIGHELPGAAPQQLQIRLLCPGC